jgi:Asp-tRNA(Asn)/Glu-tRNA(Gln) amidotransferase A subunit family amidase
VQPISSFCDSIGPLAKTAVDLALLLGVMMGRDFGHCLSKNFEGQRVVVVDQTKWTSKAVHYVKEFEQQQVRVSGTYKAPRLKYVGI